MRITRLGVVTLGLAVCAPAVASSLGIGYVGLRGSYVTADSQTTTSIDIDDDRSFSDGWGATGFMGFIVDDALRAEIEVGYRNNDIEAATVTRNTLDPTSEGLTFPVDGQVDMSLAMVNLYYDVHIDGMPFLPWVGVGAGGAYVNYQGTYDYDGAGLSSPVFAKDSDWQFAYQLMAGVTVPIAEMTSVSLGYRYLATEDMVFVDAYGFEFQTELSNHSVDVGLQFHL